MRIHIETIPHKEQKYDTCGNYWQNSRYEDIIEVRVSETGDQRADWLIAIHELIEAFLTKQAGIKWEDIDAFDKEYEVKRKKGDMSEPGDSIHAPYRRQHELATIIERRLCREVGLDWDTYDTLINAL